MMPTRAVTRVAVNGYGVIGKRIADAVTLQDDMTLIGVADRPCASAYTQSLRVPHIRISWPREPPSSQRVTRSRMPRTPLTSRRQ
jgi:glyceraldehyde-3-phosphate dehydrogenase/erythrose-4-phosphate dehydrogenase